MIMLDESTYAFDDVLLVPNYSTVSRKEVDPGIIVDGQKYDLPIIASPMDMVTSQKMISYLVETDRSIPSVHRYFNSYVEQIEYVKQSFSDFSDIKMRKVYFGVGSWNKYEDWIRGLVQNGIRRFIIDMAHGDTSHCVDTIINIKNICPDSFIIAGNVATREGFIRLQDAGADAIRVGIGSGCFTSDMKVKLSNGSLKNINEISIGDEVVTHTGNNKKVYDIFEYEYHENIVNINNKIKCTPSHEFYVVDKKYSDIVDENNIHEYAKWVSADNLTEDMLLVELDNT